MFLQNTKPTQAQIIIMPRVVAILMENTYGYLKPLIFEIMLSMKSMVVVKPQSNIISTTTTANTNGPMSDYPN
jgi:hypothetical protein